MNLLLVGLGGIFGSITRFELGKIINKTNTSSFPLGTFIINITGAFLLGIVTILCSKNAYSLLGDGFLGAYTTFSTFMYEGGNLFKDKEQLNAAFYIILSVIFGVLGFMLGALLAKTL